MRPTCRPSPGYATIRSKALPIDGGGRRDEMEALILLASGIATLVGVNLATFGNRAMDQEMKAIDKATHDRKALAKALGYE